jgi:hypothetical protein
VHRADLFPLEPVVAIAPDAFRLSSDEYWVVPDHEPTVGYLNAVKEDERLHSVRRLLFSPEKKHF